MTTISITPALARALLELRRFYANLAYIQSREPQWTREDYSEYPLKAQAIAEIVLAQAATVSDDDLRAIAEGGEPIPPGRAVYVDDKGQAWLVKRDDESEDAHE